MLVMWSYFVTLWLLSLADRIISCRGCEKDEPTIAPGDFLSMGSEEEGSDSEARMAVRRSWGRCSSSPTTCLGEEMDGLRSSPVGIMDDDPVFPPQSLCLSPDAEDFGQMEGLDLSPISPLSMQQSSMGLDKENGRFCSGWLTLQIFLIVLYSAHWPLGGRYECCFAFPETFFFFFAVHKVVTEPFRQSLC